MNIPRIRYRRQPGAGDAIMVDCTRYYTILELPPEARSLLTVNGAARLALLRHTLQCDECDPEPVWDEIGRESETDEEVRQIGAMIQQASAATAAAEVN